MSFDPAKPILFFIGYRGTGKTTVGRLLAERIGWEFVDADVVLEARFAKTIKEIFDTEGEKGFRDKESSILDQVSTIPQRVIATGGGIILREENRRLIRQRGCTVLLTTDSQTISARLALDPTTGSRRPNLASGGLDEIIQLLKVREPFYRETANFSLDVTDRSPPELVEAILTQWNPCQRF